MHYFQGIFYCSALVGKHVNACRRIERLKGTSSTDSNRLLK